jgi:hypothetical protein
MEAFKTMRSRRAIVGFKELNPESFKLFYSRGYSGGGVIIG